VILNASDNMIRNNRKRIDKKLNPFREKGNIITVVSAPDVKAEGETIIREIEERMGGTSHYQMMHTNGEKDFSGHAYRFSDFAVVFRTNAQAKAIEEAFITSGIPFQLLGASHLLKRKEITDILSYLKAVINPQDDLYLRRVITISPFNTGEADISKILGYATENGLSLYEAVKSMASQGNNGFKKFLGMMEDFDDLKKSLPIDDFLKMLLEKSGLLKLHKNSGDTYVHLENLAAAYRDIEPSEAIERFTNEINLLTPADAFDPRADRVAILTLHMAKGLEFRVVFIVGVENGLIPYTMKNDDTDIEEERRLFYVGMTRAKDDLFLIHARNRFMYGQKLSPSPSPFLNEIPEEFLHNKVIPDRVRKQKEESKQIGLF
jgi:DNA helicase-2/ATP-dependent DNA helicase PcrA